MADDTVPSGTFGDYSGTNSDAETYGGTNSICQRSGFLAKPEELVQDWNGLWVLPQFRDGRNPQDFNRQNGDETAGSIAPEIPADEFIRTSQPIQDESGDEVIDQSGGLVFSEAETITV